MFAYVNMSYKYKWNLEFKKFRHFLPGAIEVT